MAAKDCRRPVGILHIDSTVFFLCDMQEMFRSTIEYFPQVLHISNRMITCANLLGIPIIASEHKGCGETVPEIDISSFKDKIFSKQTFSMLGSQNLVDELEKMKNVKSVVLFGIMADCCIYNTALELMERNYDVHVIADGVSTVHNCERMISFERLRQSGAFVATSKAIIYNLVKDTSREDFKIFQTLVNDASPDNGLIGAYGL